MIRSREISGQSFAVVCDDHLAPQAEWILGILERIETERGKGFLRAGVRLQIGWSVFTIEQRNSSLVLCEPDFSDDPFTATRENISCSLFVQAQQNDLLRSIGQEGCRVSFYDKIVYKKGCLDSERVYLERIEPSTGDSGWYVGVEGSEPDELEAIYVYQLLAIRPRLLQVTALPPGFLVVFNGDTIEAIVNGENIEVWSGGQSD